MTQSQKGVRGSHQSRHRKGAVKLRCRARSTAPLRPRLGGILSELIAAAALVAGVAAGAESPPGPAAAPPAPWPPAFFTGSVGRVRDIDGDSFTFACEDRRVVKVRLIDADVEPMGEAGRASATAVASGLLQAQPFWVFPCGQAGSDVWADVWTSKGWLSEVLIRAGYARRRAGAEGIVQGLGPCAVAAASGGHPPPDAPAFAAVSCTALEGGALEADQGGRKVRVRLFDCTSADLDPAQQAAARDAAARILAEGPVWVLPCMPARPGGQGEALVRIWTRQGWLSEALLKGGLAKRCDGSAQAAQAAVARPGDSATTPKTPAPAKGPAAKSADITWREVPVTKAPYRPNMGAQLSGLFIGKELTPMSCRSLPFAITSGMCRITWNLQPWRVGSPVSTSLLRYDERYTVPTTSMTVVSFKGTSGSQILRLPPGQYWFSINGSTEVSIKVEEKAEPEAK